MYQQRHQQNWIQSPTPPTNHHLILSHHIQPNPLPHLIQARPQLITQLQSPTSLQIIQFLLLLMSQLRPQQSLIQSLTLPTNHPLILLHHIQASPIQVQHTTNLAAALLMIPGTKTQQTYQQIILLSTPVSIPVDTLLIILLTNILPYLQQDILQNPLQNLQPSTLKLQNLPPMLQLLNV